MKKILIDNVKGLSIKKIHSILEDNLKDNEKYGVFIEIFDFKNNEISEGKLKNIPFSIKDNFLYKGHIASCGSKMLENYRSCYTAFVIEKLIKEGAFIVGRTNMDEFAMGSSTENSAYFKTKNPIDPKYVPGGSSGGAAASVALGMSAFALGSDTGGSVRQPAAFCGLYGFKPTYGAFSRRGVVAFCSSFDQVGIIANSVEDISLCSSVMNDKDPYDLTSYQDRELQEIRPIKCENVNLKDKIVGFINQFDGIPISDDVQKSYIKFVNELKKMKVEVVNISPPFIDLTVPIYQILSTTEASSNLARFDGVKYGLSAKGKTYKEIMTTTRMKGFGDEVKRRIMLGTFVSSAGYSDQYYSKALKMRSLLKRNYNTLFATVDLIVLPTTPDIPFKLGEKIDDPVSMYYSDVFTAIANIIGSPAITLPVYTTSRGMPIGMQLMSNAKTDVDLLKHSAKIMRTLK